jgi:peptidoglycan/LPS O-acetylase OafA/YrhL
MIGPPKLHVFLSTGWVNKFLSWKLFMPLGRLTYSSYIWSLSIQMLFQWSRKDVQYFDHFLMASCPIFN